MDTLLNLASDLGDISAEEERGADRLHASIFMPAVPSEEPPPRDAAAELASTEHLVNLLANLSDARESFAAAWDDASRSSRGEEPPPEPPAAEKRSDALARAARARSDLARRPSLRAFVAEHEKKSEGLARAARAKRATVERRGPASPTKQRAKASELASSHLAAREAREAARLAKIEEEIAESCTFRPALATRDAPPPPPGATTAVRLGTKPSRGSEAILQKGDLAPFAERERRRAVERRDAARETRETRERELRETCFKPEISARSRALDDVAEARRRAEEKHGVYDPSRSRAAADAEPASRVALRAAKLAKDAAKADARKAKLRAARDAEHSFKPTLNERTKATDYKPSTKALAENARGKQQREKLEAEGRARRAADCPFRPTLAAAPRRLARSARTDAERKRDRDDKHRAALKQRELDELMECSFQPFTNNRQKREARPQSATGRPTAVRPVVVRGLARHLENRQRAAALAEEKRTREHAAFHVAKAEEWRQGQNHTKVEPFALST